MKIICFPRQRGKSIVLDFLRKEYEKNRKNRKKESQFDSAWVEESIEVKK